MKEIEIMDYKSDKVPVKIENFDNVVRLTIEVISRDEILNILYKDYTQEKYDSCHMLHNFRIQNFYDDEYIIYDITKNIDYINSWSKRKNSYSYKLKEGKK